MATKAADQISIIDITDSYTIMLTSEAYTFVGGTTYANAGTCETTVIAYQGNDSVVATVGTCTCPTGVTASVTNNGTASPKITFTVAANAISAPCEVTIPITVGDGVEFTKKFSIGVALKGATGAKGDKGDNITISSKSVTYQVGTSGTTPPTGSWSDSVPSVSNGQYLWTKTYVKYSDGNSTEAYSVSYKGTNGTNGTSVTVSSTSVTYQASSNGTTTPTGTWSDSVPSVSNGQYLWTKTYVKYSDGKETTSYSVAYKGTNGTNGTNGADAITIAITSSAGFIFKNASIATTLTAHVYKAGKELTSSTSPTLASQGTIKWYKNGGTTAVGTGSTLTISAGDVTNKATYTAQLEG
jgi:hypothetical protein